MIQICPDCNHEKLIKKGFDNKTGKQLWKCKACGRRTVSPKQYISDKKIGEVSWREIAEYLGEGQKIFQKASKSQDKATIKVTTDQDYIIYQPLSDLHIGAKGCNYSQLVQFTDAILEIPNLYFSTHGDHTDNFNRFKNMLAVHQMKLSPEEQLKFFESWLEETKHKYLYSTWGNHEEMEERASGINSIKNILSNHLIYFNGIGVATLMVNDIEYVIVVTHKTRFNSSFNGTHGLKQLARKEYPNADIYISGHTHTPDYERVPERGRLQVFIVSSSLKFDDGYSKRYFSYWVENAMPCLVLGAKEKSFVPFWTLGEAFQYIGLEWEKYILKGYKKKTVQKIEQKSKKVSKKTKKKTSKVKR